MSAHRLITDLLAAFDPISLKELESYTLLDRVDFKYVFTADKIPSILSSLEKSYRSLDICSLRAFPYLTTYYDSSDWFFFRQHVKERGHRSKVRVRKYEQTGVSFLEVKNRTNKLRTEKWRILKAVGINDSFDEESDRFIRTYVPAETPEIRPVLINRFTRITLASKIEEERITLDYDISFSDLKGNLLPISCLGILERKRPDFSNRSLLSETVKKLGIHPVGFSKYCLGTSYLYDAPGRNTLKPKHLLINKLQNECI
jgi:hypothetical protein